MLNAVTSLEGVLPVLDQRHILQALLSPQPLGNGSLAPVLILRPLLCPQSQLDSFLRNRIAGLVLQVLCALCAVSLPSTGLKRLWNVPNSVVQALKGPRPHDPPTKPNHCLL